MKLLCEESNTLREIIAEDLTDIEIQHYSAVLVLFTSGMCHIETSTRNWGRAGPVETRTNHGGISVRDQKLEVMCRIREKKTQEKQTKQPKERGNKNRRKTEN